MTSTLAIKADTSITRFVVSSQHGSLELQHADDGTRLTRLTDAEGRDYLRRANLLWQIEMINQENERAPLTMPATVPNARQADEEIRLVWNEAPIGQTGEQVTVKVVLHIDERTGAMAWHLAVEDVPADWSVYRVHFPRLDVAVDRSEKDAVILPHDRGVIYHDPLSSMPTGGVYERLRKRAYPHGGHTMQFAAIQREDRLLYVGAHDPAGQLKVFFIGPDAEQGHVYIHPRMDTEVHFGKDWTQSFPWVIRLLKGDWFDVAQIYRAFALTASWMHKGPLSAGRKTPAWYQRTGVVTLRLNRGPGFEDEDILAEREFLGLPMVCHYYMWHQTAFDANYPFFFPAVPTFRDTVRKLESAGVRVMPYVNIFSGDMSTGAWKQGLDASALNITPDGDFDLHVWSQNRTFAALCPGSDMTRSLMQMTAMSVFGMGTSGIYFDEIGMSAAYPCYHRKHNHTPGGGAWFITEMNESLSKVRDQAAQIHDGPIITTEGCAESYISQIDAMLTGNDIRDNALPLFEAVYHDHVMVFGRYTFTQDLVDPRFEGAIISKHAQQFIFGAQFGWSRIPLSVIMQKSPVTAEFLKHLAHTWHHSYDFLAQGKMLRPLDLSDQVKRVTRHWCVGWDDPHGVDISLPAVMNSAWQRADGAVAVVLVNITDDPQTVRVDAPRDAGIAPDAVANVRRLVGDQLRISAGEGAMELGTPVKLEPRTAAVVVFAVQSETRGRD